MWEWFFFFKNWSYNKDTPTTDGVWDLWKIVYNWEKNLRKKGSEGIGFILKYLI
jgi:hypothetical protein